MEMAVDFMSNEPILAHEGGTAEVMDAAVLQAINDGWRIYKGLDPFGDGGQGWSTFFQGVEAFENKEIDVNQLIAIRLEAEQYGVDYSWGLSDVQTAYGNSDTLDQIYFDIFKGGADSYRASAIDFRSNPLAVNRAETRNASFLLTVTDPRTSGPILNIMGKFGYPVALFLWGQLQPPLLYYP